MWQIMEELAHQREREIAARTRSLLLTHHPASQSSTQQGQSSRRNRSEPGRTKLPPLSLGKWRHWVARGSNEVHCSRAAATGAC